MLFLEASNSKSIVTNDARLAVCAAGASFFYKPGTLPYEAQEVRAFGLFLNDMLARLEAPDKPSAVRSSLEEITADALQRDSSCRPSFQAIAARCSSLKKVN